MRTPSFLRLRLGLGVPHPHPHPHMAQFKVHDMRGDLTPRGQRAVCACAQEREEGEFAFGGEKKKKKQVEGRIGV